MRRGDVFELHRLFQVIAGHVGAHVGRHLLDRALDRRGIAVLDKAEHGIPHDQRRVGRIEDDDRLALASAAHLLDAPRRGPRELVDVRAGARSGRSARNAGDDLGVRRRCNAGDRRDDRNRRLAAAGDEVHVGLIGQLMEVDRRNQVRTDGRRREIDDLLRMGAQHRIVARVRAGRRRVEHDRDVVEARHLDEAVDAVRGDRHAEPPRAREPIGLRIDADERSHLELRGRPQDLDHQVRADIAAADDGDFDAHRCTRAYGVSVIVSTLKSLFIT